jgi:hypothetical protein
MSNESNERKVERTETEAAERLSIYLAARRRAREDEKRAAEGARRLARERRAVTTFLSE